MAKKSIKPLSGVSRTIHTAPPTEDFPIDMPREMARMEFARRLQAAMDAKGFNQSETARQASLHMAGGKSLNRDIVSKYLAGATGPSALALSALAKALGKTTAELMPTRGVTSKMDPAPALEMRTLSDGMVLLRINQRVPADVALRIHQVLGEMNPVGRPDDR